MDAIQAVNIIVLITIAISISVVTVYLVLLLKELREAVKDADKAIQDIGNITGAVGGPVATAAGILEGLARGTKAFKTISSIFSKDEEK